MTALSKRERTLVGMAAGIAIVVAGYVYLVEPTVARTREQAALIPAREEVLTKRRALIGRRAAYAAKLEEISRAVEHASSRSLPGATPPLAASELQKLVKELAGQSGVEVRSERILQPVERGSLLEIPVEITVAGGIRELLTLLYRLEGTTKVLTLQDLKVRVISVGQPKELLTTLTVSGYILPSGPTQKQGEKPEGSPRG
ncbi:MAG: type 4a pilus biogenesis protein PilO [Candidatus Rokubacteria bacterium]|nr:type 4a pilus biogenesis protein PilO [Candidatus Rokubacteria bacterium]